MLKDEILTEMYASGVYQKYFQKLVNSSHRKSGKKCWSKGNVSNFLLLLHHQENYSMWLVVADHFSARARKPVGELKVWIHLRALQRLQKKKYGIAVHSEYFESFETIQKYNAVSVLGLEHLQKPWMAIQKAHDLLEDDGIFYFEGPSADCFLWEYLKQYPFAATRYIEAGRHYLFFSRKCIAKFVMTLGLESNF